MKKKERAISALTYIILFILIIFAAAVFLPKLFGLSGLYVEARSMEPTIKKGDLLLIENVEFQDIGEGDVISFVNSSRTKRCTHRVVKVDSENKAFVTKGDNNNVNDPYETPFEYVIGRVKYKIPLAGYVFGVLDTRAARVTAVVLAVVFAALEIELYKSRKKEMNEK